MEMSDEMFMAIHETMKELGFIDDRDLDVWTYRVKEDNRLLVTSFENYKGDTLKQVYASPWKDMMERMIPLIGVPEEAIEVSRVKAWEATMSIIPLINSGELSMTMSEEKNFLIEALIALDEYRYGMYAKQLVEWPIEQEAD